MVSACLLRPDFSRVESWDSSWVCCVGYFEERSIKLGEGWWLGSICDGAVAGMAIGER